MAAPIDLKSYGPLAALIGVWQGDKGDDIAPSDDRGIENNKYREQMIFEPIGGVDNHEQKMFGLRYSTMAWRLGEADPFHQDTGYWLYEAKTNLVMRCFTVPRGIAIIAGGIVGPHAKKFSLSAELGSSTFGICSNPFLDNQFKTTKFLHEVELLQDGVFSYSSDTQIKMPGKNEIFHHTDKNTLHRVS